MIYKDISAREIDAVLKQSQDAFVQYRAVKGIVKAAFLEQIATGIEALDRARFERVVRAHRQVRHVISGHVHRPGAYEYPLGTRLETLLEAAGGVQGHLKAIIVGGLSVPILTAKEAEGLLLDYDSCMKRGTMLGSGGIMVMNETTSIPEVACRAISFYAHESCGQCTPCRQGSHVVSKLLHRITSGHGERKDIDRVLKLCEAIKGTTLCPTGEAFSTPIEAMVRKFRPEFEARIR